MKFQLFALLLVIAGACAKPSVNDVVVVNEISGEKAPRFVVESQIRRIIQQIRDGIQNAGLDPLDIERADIKVSPVPYLVEISAFIDNLQFNGLSNIRIHNLDYSIVFNRLRFDLSLPAINLVVGDSGISASAFGSNYEGSFKGSLSIISVRLSGEIRVNVGIISGISLRSVSLNFTLGGIESNLNVVVLENDISESLNKFLGESIPQFVTDNRADINKVLEDLVKEIFERVTYLY